MKRNIDFLSVLGLLLFFFPLSGLSALFGHVNWLAPLGFHVYIFNKDRIPIDILHQLLEFLALNALWCFSHFPS